MPAPCLDIVHLKTSKQYNGATLIHRYWFEWSNRRNLSAVVVRLDLLDAAGNVVAKSSLKLPKVTITSYIPATETSPERPVYDGTTWMSVDDPIRDTLPVSFRYLTVGVLKKSDIATGLMEGVFDDLSSVG